MNSHARGTTPPSDAKWLRPEATYIWQDYDLVNLGKVARNALAHEGEFASAPDCDKYIDAIESELRAWDVL